MEETPVIKEEVKDVKIIGGGATGTSPVVAPAPVPAEAVAAAPAATPTATPAPAEVVAPTPAAAPAPVEVVAPTPAEPPAPAPAPVSVGGATLEPVILPSEPLLGPKGPVPVITPAVPVEVKSEPMINTTSMCAITITSIKWSIMDKSFKIRIDCISNHNFFCMSVYN